ncbi:MAG: redox-sensing transcriptional repressor Rex [Pirellulales bacterium]|nr:redox-sensing transcriptional repressor Rex [Pirellulales bacterium]
MTSSGKKKLADSVPAQVPKAVVNRLSFYLRELQRLLRDGKETISSRQLGRLLEFTDAQVRKDLAYFGHFGYPGIGYRCDELVTAIRKILATDQSWNVAMIGAGNLGRALLGYGGFEQQGFRVIAAFDAHPKKVGTSIGTVPIHPMDQLESLIQQQEIKLAIIAVPAPAAQEVADRLVVAGIEGILNFAPVTISLPNTVSQVGVDLAIELEQLSFSVCNRKFAAARKLNRGGKHKAADKPADLADALADDDSELESPDELASGDLLEGESA